MKKSLETCFFLLCTALFLSVQGSFFKAPLRGEAEESKDYACAQTMMDEGKTLVEGYEDLLDAFFKIDKPTSDQVAQAMDFYRSIEDSLSALYADAATVSSDGSKSSGFASAELTYCSNIRDQYIDFARVLLQKQVLASAGSKTTFKVVDGLKVLNENLEDFSREFLETFPGVFNQMSNALPCYARQCIQ